MKNLLALITLTLTLNCFSQRILQESVSYFDIIKPKETLDSAIKTYNVIVNIPYTMTVDDVKAKSLSDFEIEKDNYQNLVEQSKKDYQTKLDNYDIEVKQAKDNYDAEMKDFKELSLLERLALTDQGKKPQLKTPSRPTYVKPNEPIYREPKLGDYLIFDKNALADNIKLNGFEKGDDLVFTIDLKKMEFQENAGQTFYKQPANLTISANSAIIAERTFGDESKFLTSSSSNTINVNRYEKQNVKKTLKTIEKYINQTYGYTPVAKKINIAYPKNKKREYDKLERAKITAVSAFRKMTKEATMERRKMAISELEKAEAIWNSELEKINYKDKKAIYNGTIAKSIFFNLLSTQTQLGNKEKAEQTLSKFQDKLLDLKLNYTENNRIKDLENQIYKL